MWFEGGDGFEIGVEVFVSYDLYPLELIESFVPTLSRFSDPTRDTLGVVDRFGFGISVEFIKLISKVSIFQPGFSMINLRSNDSTEGRFSGFCWSILLNVVNRSSE